MTPVRNDAETTEVIDIAISDTTKQRNASTVDDTDESKHQSIEPQAMTMKVDGTTTTET
jgi:hypothetical protein